ncbi:MAG: hypothetical protein K2P53_01695 [Rickettsiales bacterium]|nr:hypothetical protein [Silvanigrellaceae bacterium]MBY0580386.1 hypothetical protein [Rickettsiales bacterium]
MNVKKILNSVKEKFYLSTLLDNICRRDNLVKNHQNIPNQLESILCKIKKDPSKHKIYSPVKSFKKIFLYNLTQENMILKISKVTESNREIKVGVVYSSPFSSLFHNIGENYYNPSTIIRDYDVQFFSLQDQSYLRDYSNLNNAFNIINNKKANRIVMGNKILIISDGSEHDPFFFEIDEKEFTFKLNKFAYTDDVRKIIRNLIA